MPANGSSIQASNKKLNVYDEIPEVVEKFENSSQAESTEEPSEPPTPFMLFLQGLNPINVEEWSEMKIYAKVYEVFKCPIVFFINCNTPVIDYEIEDTHNWNRYLQVFQIFSAPTFIVVLIQRKYLSECLIIQLTNFN